MIINYIKLKDFGVFKGEHTFDLSPFHGPSSKRPIILFGGNNGSGKTTLLNAVLLALYGNYVEGKYLSQKTSKAGVHPLRSSSNTPELMG